tara:strand:+ start:294 stop:497 length:204 start_codon:yes stop_codon:yes gene_type:complete
MTDLDMFIDYKGKIKSLKNKLKTLTNKKKEEKMLIYGNTPQDLKKKLLNNKSYLIVFVVGFIFGLLI